MLIALPRLLRDSGSQLDSITCSTPAVKLCQGRDGAELTQEKLRPPETPAILDVTEPDWVAGFAWAWLHVLYTDRMMNAKGWRLMYLATVLGRFGKLARTGSKAAHHKGCDSGARKGSDSCYPPRAICKEQEAMPWTHNNDKV